MFINIFNKKKNKELSNHLARQIRSECPKENQRELKRLFNIALNLKSIEEEKIEKEIIEEDNDEPKMKYRKIEEMVAKGRKKKAKKAKKKCLMKESEADFDIDEE